MASKLLLRSSPFTSPHQTPKCLHPSASLTSPNLTFHPSPFKSTLSISQPQFLTPLQSPNPIFKSPITTTTTTTNPFNPFICRATYTPTPASDRLISILSYFIPFLAGLTYGYHLFSAFPFVERLFNPLVPLLSFYRSIPHVNFLTFFGLYLGVVRDRKFSRYVRFNALQAVFLEFLLVLPSLMNILFSYGEGFGFALLQVIHSGLFVGIVGCFVYTLGACLLGRTPRFPYVTGAMEWRLNAEDQWG